MTRLFKTGLFKSGALIAGMLAAMPAFGADTHVVTDRMGREVEIPVEINRVATNFLPFASAWFISTGGVDELVGIAAGSKAHAARSIFGRIVPEVLEIETDFQDGNNVNVEAVLALEPDVFFTYEKNPSIELIENAGIPVLSLDVLSQTGGNAMETFAGWMDLLGLVAGQEERAGEIAAMARDTLAEVRARVEPLSEAERPRAMFFSRLQEDRILINGAGHFGDFWLREAGAINVATEGLAPLAEVSMEEIYAMNPDVMFISNFSSTMPEDVYANNIPGQDWSHVFAVQNRRVYKLPEGIFQWYPPSADTPMMMKFMASSVHPELFADYDMEEELKAYYARFYDYELSQDDLDLILHRNR